jgi:Na+-translocating ferredoxin:NAD+ oxidoreductase RNF subunit RnfB
VIEIISVTAIGLIFGLVLSIAADKFRVEVDERLEKTIGVLPGANCGACGFMGCSAFAEALIKDPSIANRCAQTYTDEDKLIELSDILGMEVGKKEEAVVICNGGKHCEDKFQYYGRYSCQLVDRFFQGNKACEYGCLGFGDCVEVCPTKAIEMNEDMLPEIDRDRCTGCGACADVCPRNIIKIIPKESPVYLTCNNSFDWEEPLEDFIFSIKDKGEFSADFTGTRVYEGSKWNLPVCGRCLKCLDACPRDALVFEIKGGREYITKTVQGEIRVKEDMCICCSRCESICPEDIIKVKKPLKGIIEIDQEKCNGRECGICTHLCPAWNISFTEEGLISFGDYCIYCGMCEAACPTNAIKVSVEDVDVSGRWSKITEEIKKCKNICRKCKRCIDACEKGAIIWDEESNLPRILTEKCVECEDYACVDACPIGIIRKKV